MEKLPDGKIVLNPSEQYDARGVLFYGYRGLSDEATHKFLFPPQNILKVKNLGDIENGEAVELTAEQSQDLESALENIVKKEEKLRTYVAEEEITELETVVPEDEDTLVEQRTERVIEIARRLITALDD